MKKKLIWASIVCLLFSVTLGTGQAINKNGGTIKISPAINIETTSRRSKSTVLGYQPNQIRHAYGIDKLNASGKGQTIAIIDSYGSPTIEKDLDIFNKKFDLDSSKLTIKYPDGEPTTTDLNWGIETTLDVEWAHSLAPKANILLVVAKSDSIDDLMNAVDYASKEGVHVISMSWGGSEFSDMSIYDEHFKHPNTVYIASSGDSGTEVQWPAVVPNVLAVGGTTPLILELN
jgi:subtilase family serine protease